MRGFLACVLTGANGGKTLEVSEDQAKWHRKVKVPA